MEDSWFLSALMLVNANTSKLETKEMKSQRELYIVIDEMTNTLEHLGKKTEKHNEDSSNRISQLEAYLTATPDELDHYFHHAFPAYTEKEETGMLKGENETLKEEKNKLRHAMYEKNISMKRLTETLNKERA